MAPVPTSTQRQREAARERPAIDPPTRPDGLCLQCDGPRPAIAVAHDDPFCLGGCARAWHGVSLPEAPKGGRKR
jgi:hypothetical protein